MLLKNLSNFIENNKKAKMNKDYNKNKNQISAKLSREREKACLSGCVQSNIENIRKINDLEKELNSIKKRINKMICN